jgi:AraC family transcriptional regulator
MKLPSTNFYGDILSNVYIAGLTLSETSYASKLKLPKHSHEHAYFCFVLEGAFIEVYGRRTRSCHPSTVVFHPAYESHSDFFHSDSRCFNLQMSRTWLERVSRETKLLDSPADFNSGSLVKLSWRLFSEFCKSDVYSRLIIEALALEILAEASRNSTKDRATPTAPRWLVQVRELLHERFCEHLSHEQIAASVDVHPVHMAREFRRFHQCTIGEYLRKLRIEFACSQLSASETPLSEIAIAAGFFDQSHFARTFKTLTGMTPHQYRTAFRSRKYVH